MCFWSILGTKTTFLDIWRKSSKIQQFEQIPGYPRFPHKCHQMSKNVVFVPKMLQKQIQSSFWVHILTKVCLSVILSILARACASQKRKAKPLEIKPKWPKKSKNVVLGYKKGSKFDSDFIFSFSGSLRSYNIPLRVISNLPCPPRSTHTSNNMLSIWLHMTNYSNYPPHKIPKFFSLFFWNF